MSITKHQVISQIEVTESGFVQVRTSTRIMEDGVQLGHDQYHRHMLAPGDDLTGQDARVAAIATAAWTLEFIAAYQEKLSG